MNLRQKGNIICRTQTWAVSFYERQVVVQAFTFAQEKGKINAALQRHSSCQKENEPDIGLS